MSSLNQVTLLGRLTRDPQVKSIPSGQQVCEFGLAINRKWKDQNGAQKEETTFVDCAAWGNVGGVVANYTKKGNLLLVCGRLHFSAWVESSGAARNKLSVVAESVVLMPNKDQAQSAQKQSEYQEYVQPAPQAPPQPAMAGAPGNQFPIPEQFNGDQPPF